jgi:hypothetical protein
MRRRFVLLAGVSSTVSAATRALAALSGLMSPSAARAARQSDALEAAAAALGAKTIQTLQFTGSGASFTVGQNFTPDDPWPLVPVKRYDARINYETSSMEVDLVREMGATMPRGGGVPFNGELRQVQVVGGDFAWNVPVPVSAQYRTPPATCCTLPEAGSTGAAGPAPESLLLCRLTLWSIPQGFVRAAIANDARATKLTNRIEVAFTLDGKYRMVGTINAQNQVERVRTWISQSIVGDMPVETEYRDYRDFGGVQFPSRIVQMQDGFPSLELAVASVTVNGAVDITIPDAVRNAARSAPESVDARKVADGVFWLVGGTHHSLAIEMNDHIVLVDTPNGEARALAVPRESKGRHWRQADSLRHRHASPSRTKPTGHCSSARQSHGTRSTRIDRAVSWRSNPWHIGSRETGRQVVFERSRSSGDDPLGWRGRWPEYSSPRLRR